MSPALLASKSILENAEKMLLGFEQEKKNAKTSPQPDLFQFQEKESAKELAIVHKLKKLDLSNITPLQALNLLHQLRETI